MTDGERCEGCGEQSVHIVYVNGRALCLRCRKDLPNQGWRAVRDEALSLYNDHHDQQGEES
jgi:hypothetical protein